MNEFDWLGVAILDWQQISARLSFTLLHFLWQGLVVGLIVATAFRVGQRLSANSRYIVASISLFCLPIIAACTFSIITLPSEFAGDVESLNVAMSSKHVATPITSPSVVTGDSIERSRPFDVQPSSDMNSELSANRPEVEPNTTTRAVESSSLRLFYPFMPWLSALYVLGVGMMLLRLLLAMRRGSRFGSQSTPVSDAMLLKTVAGLTRQMGMKVVPAVFYCERIAVPAVFGILRPAILFPASLVSNLTLNELAAILSHELAHIRRLDPIFHLLQKAIESLLFFHPAVWWISRQVRTERENCCDEMAAEAGFGRVGYASALLRIAELCAPNRGHRFASQFSALSADGTRPNHLSRRIERLLDMNNSPLTPVRLFNFVVVFLLMVGIASVAAIASSLDVTSDVRKGAIVATAPTGGRVTKSDEAGNQSLKEAVKCLNEENKRLEIGLDQEPLTEDEVVAAIRNAVWDRVSGRLNEAEFVLLKGIAQSRLFPDGAYFSVQTHQQSETFVVKHFWHVDLYVPAIGHDGFVPFTVRHSDFPDEKIDPDSIAWGEPDADGMTLGACFSPNKASYKSGERVLLLMFVRNDGPEPVGATWSRLTEPRIEDFTVIDEKGGKVAVHLGHDNWAQAMVSGAIGGHLPPGGTYFFRVPFEIRIGKPETKNSNELIGRIIDAKPGQKLKLKVRSTTGNNRTRMSSDPWMDTGIIEFNVAD